MDPTAVNYDENANVNTGTWCVPYVEGCMMPSPETVSTATAATTREHFLDGGSATFSSIATVHILAECEVGRYGCMDPAAVNYDPHATMSDGSCWGFDSAYLYGCLHPLALNFNCTSKDDIAECVPTDRSMVPVYHDQVVCNFALYPPPPPSPGYPPNTVTQTVVEITMLASGEVADYTE